MTWWCAVDHKPFLLPTVFYHMILVVSVTMSSSFSRTGHAFKKVFLKPNLTFFLPKPSHSLHFVGKSSVFTITKAPLSFEFWLSKWVLLIFFLSLSLVVKVDELKYLGSAIEGNRQCTKRGEEESEGWAEWVETTVRCDLWQTDGSKTEKGLQGSETCYDVLLGDDTDIKEELNMVLMMMKKIFIVSSQDGQD